MVELGCELALYTDGVSERLCSPPRTIQTHTHAHTPLPLRPRKRTDKRRRYPLDTVRYSRSLQQTGVFERHGLSRAWRTRACHPRALPPLLQVAIAGGAQHNKSVLYNKSVLNNKPVFLNATVQSSQVTARLG